MASPVLDLTTTRERPHVCINTIEYVVRIFEDLTLDQVQRVDVLTPRIGGWLQQRGGLSKTEASALKAALMEMCTIALDAPPKVLAKLSVLQSVLVFKVFFERLSPSLLAASAVLAARPSSSARSSRSSNGSTGGRRSRGSRARPSA